MTICEYIDSIIKERGISRRKLAISAGIAPPSLQSAFARNTTLSLDMLLPILDFLGLPKGEVLKTYGYGSLVYDFEKTAETISKKQTVTEMVEEADKATHELEEIILDNPKAFLLIDSFVKLSDAGQEIVIDISESLLTIPKYRKEENKTPPAGAEPAGGAEENG